MTKDDKVVKFPFGPIPNWFSANDLLPDHYAAVIISKHDGCQTGYYDAKFKKWFDADWQETSVEFWTPFPQPYGGN